jgi:transcriptional regulator with PAS, ATPase and Fis domain
MEKIKILAIAPYDSLKDVIVATAVQHNDIDVEVYTGDLSRGVSLARDELVHEYDFILSRGGTGEMIERITDTPVINIEISGYDMLHVIKMTQNYGGKFAIVGFKNITKDAKLLCDLLQYEADIITISNSEEVHNCLISLREKGYGLIIGDSITIATAHELGLNGILLTSGKESVERAFEIARQLHRLNRKKNFQLKLFHDIVSHSGMHIVVFDKNGECDYKSFSTNDTIYAPMILDLKNYVKNVFLHKDGTVLKKYHNKLFKIQGKIITRDHESYCVFFITPSVNLEHMDDQMFYVKNPLLTTACTLASFFDTSDYIRKIYETSQKYSRVLSPLLISGEIGTGKDTIANYVHANSPRKTRSFLTINCEILNEKGWHILFTSEDSPLNDSDYTVYFKNIHALPKPLQRKLDVYMENTCFHKRHRIISSSVVDLANMAKCGEFNWSLYKRISSLTLNLLPLEERKDEIASIASILISKLNLKYAKQIIGPDENSLNLLKNFSWDFNIDQLKSVLTELVILSDGPYISEADTALVLQNTPKITMRESDAYLDLNKTLDEINKDIINFVLNLENQNQSKASKRLGISRSTMWRKLK